MYQQTSKTETKFNPENNGRGMSKAKESSLRAPVSYHPSGDQGAISHGGGEVVQRYFEVDFEDYGSEESVERNQDKFFNVVPPQMLGKRMKEEMLRTLKSWASDMEDWGENWSYKSIMKFLYETIKKRISADPEFEAGDASDLINSFGALAGDRDLTSWIGVFHDAEYYIRDLRQVLDNDGDIALLDSFEKKLNDYKNEMEGLKQQLLSAPKEDRDLRIQIRNFMEAVPTQIGNLFKSLKTNFPMNSGGFSAKGRAHEMDTTMLDDEDYTKDENYLGSFTLDDSKIEENAIYKKNLNVEEAASEPIMPPNIQYIAQTQGLPAALTAYENELNETIDTPQNVVYTTTPVSADRNGGQVKNMDNTNASAYAMLSQTPNWKTKKWEWLHVQAASLGGATNGTNLVLGTQDANTHMMPFEANIRHLATLVSKSSDYEQLEVSYSVNNGPNGAALHSYNQIRMAWKLVKAEDAGMGAKDLKGQATFAPLSTNSSISKDEIGIIESALKEKREGVSD